MTNVHEPGVRATIALASAAPQQFVNDAAAGTPGGAMLRSPDSIRRMIPQSMSAGQNVLPIGIGNGIGGGMNTIIQQLLNIIQQLLSSFGLGGFGGLGGGNFWNQPQGAQTYFQNANGSSTGDPHLRFNGTSGTGANQSSHFDSMTGHSDLLDSDSFAGGYQIATSVTQPAANGITYNQQATITTNFGGTQVSLDKNGNATIDQNGQMITLANGQSYNAGNGETVTRNANGSLAVTDDNGMGGTITTTLSENGQGVDVSVQANNVDLGGDLLNQPGERVPLRIGEPRRQTLNYEMA